MGKLKVKEEEAELNELRKTFSLLHENFRPKCKSSAVGVLYAKRSKFSQEKLSHFVTEEKPLFYASYNTPVKSNISVRLSMDVSRF